MKNRTLLAASLLIALAATACSSPSDPAPFDASTDLEARLEADTGVKWALLKDGAAAPRLLGPTHSVKLPGADHESQTRAFFANYGAALGPNSLSASLHLVEDQTGPDGTHDTTFEHRLPGTELPVFDARSAAHFGEDGAIRYIESALNFDLSKVPTKAAISEAQARTEADAQVMKSCEGAAVGEPVIALGGFPTGNGTVVLTYRVEYREGIGSCHAPTVFVDANSRSIVHMRQDATEIADTSRGGSFHHWNDASDIKALDVSRNPDASYELRTATSTPTVSTQYYAANGLRYPVRANALGSWDSLDKGTSVDAHYYATKALEYFRIVHGRNGPFRP